MTSFRLYVCFTILVLFVIIFYCFILCNMDPYQTMPAHLTSGWHQEMHSNFTFVANRKGQNSSPQHSPYSGYKSNFMLFHSKRDVLSLKSQLVYSLMQQEENFASQISMHDDEEGDERSSSHHQMGRSNPRPVFQKETLCNIPFRGIDPTFPGIVHHGVYRVLPTQRLDSLIKSFTSKRRGGRDASCGLVSSADSIIGSMSGKSIDAHDLVLRFDGAVLSNETAVDAGSRTSIRILNSHYFTSNLFNVSRTLHEAAVLIIRDNFTSNSEPDASALYGKYVNYRENFPEIRMYILNPISIRESVQLLRSASSSRLPAEIRPSSGFVGLLMLMRFCPRVRAYEFVPSIRTCRDQITNSYKCTFALAGARSSEKLFAWKLNHASDRSVIIRGRSDFTGCMK